MNSILEQINTVCSKIRKDLKYPTTFKIILNNTRKEFRKAEIDLAIKSKRQKFLNYEEFYVNAYYDAEDDEIKETPIEVIIYHNFDNFFIWDNKHVSDLLIQIYDAVVHEIRHQRQSKKRNYVIYNETPHEPYGEYLSDPDELDAYAISIAIELCRNLGKWRALNYMSRFSALGKFKIQNQYVSPNLHAYISHFGDTKPDLIKKLAKKVYVRLKKIDMDYVFV